VETVRVKAIREMSKRRSMFMVGADEDIRIAREPNRYREIKLQGNQFWKVLDQLVRGQFIA